MSKQQKTETETTAAPAAPQTTSVVLAYPWTDADGKTHEPDSTVQVDRSTARDLIRDGRARAVASTDPKE